MTLGTWGLILLGVGSRFLPHLPNATPLVAIALFGGRYLSRRQACAMPLACIIMSDLAIGLHDVIPFTWGSVLLITGFGVWLRRWRGVVPLVAATLASSLLFYLVTNFGTWLSAAHLYPRTWLGLSACYAMGLPFFWNMVLGDLVYVAGMFGTYTVLEWWAERRRRNAPVTLWAG